MQGDSFTWLALAAFSAALVASLDDRAGAGQTVTEIAVKRADQSANKDDPDEAPKEERMWHRQRL